ncbi:MAG: PepSY domain-containing protein [bacterium]
MKINRKVLAIAAATVVVAAGGVGIAYAVGGDSEEQVTGPDADKAAAAAIDQVGGGTVTEVEYQDNDGAGLYEVEVRRDDGSQVEVHLSGGFDTVGTAPDDDAAGNEGEGAGDDD